MKADKLNPKNRINFTETADDKPPNNLPVYDDPSEFPYEAASIYFDILLMSAGFSLGVLVGWWLWA